MVENIRKAMFEQGVIFEEDRINRFDGGQISTEKVLRIELFNTTSAEIERFVEILKLAFNQESILVESIDSSQDIF